MLECCRQVTKEVMIWIVNKYGLIEFTNFCQINHNFWSFSTNTSYVTSSILIWRVVWLPVLHTFTWDSVSFFYVRTWINLAQNLCKFKEKCFTYIIKDLLNRYWWILALVGFKMHWQAHAFLQPTHANIHQSQFNNPII